MNNVIYNHSTKIALALFVLVGMTDAAHASGSQGPASLHASGYSGHASGSQDPLPSQANATRMIQLFSPNGEKIGQGSIAGHTDIPRIIDKVMRRFLWNIFAEDSPLKDKIKTDPYFGGSLTDISELYNPNKDKWNTKHLPCSESQEAIIHSTAYSIILPDNTEITMKHEINDEGELMLRPDTVQSMQNIDWTNIETVKWVRLNPLTNVLVGSTSKFVRYRFPNLENDSNIWFNIRHSLKSQSDSPDRVLEKEINHIIMQVRGRLGLPINEEDKAKLESTATWIKNNCERLFGYTRELIHFREGGSLDKILIQFNGKLEKFGVQIHSSHIYEEDKLLISLCALNCGDIDDNNIHTQLANSIHAILNKAVHNSVDGDEVVGVGDVNAIGGVLGSSSHRC